VIRTRSRGRAAGTLAVRLRRPGILIALTVLTALPGLPQVNEYQVKAFFLYNFARYVEWPPQSLQKAGDPIAICILGQNPFGSSLDEAVRGKMVENHAFTVRVVPDMPAPGACQILFVHPGERRRFRAGAARLRGTGLLSVGENPGFLGDGGVVNFRLEDGKVRFEIDVEAAAREHLRISSKLLSLAVVARGGEASR
jgi:hypothetical protein